MKARLEDKNKAIELRKLGKSYKEIQEVVKVSKGLLSMWLSKLSLTSDEQNLLIKKLEDRRNRGRLNSKILNQTRRLDRERKAIAEAQKGFQKWKSNPQFLIGLSLLWAKGVKTASDIRLSSIDTDLIFYMHAWFLKFLSIPKEGIQVRLFVENTPNVESMRVFWAKNLDLKAESVKLSLQKKPDILKNDPFYKGCLELTVFGVKHLRSVRAWQKMAVELHYRALLSHK
jgi:hypothetical protein